MKYILLISFILFPVIANAEATGGYSFGNALDRLAALILGSPIAGVIGAIVFSLTLKKLFYPGILKYFLGLIGGVIGMLLSIWILNDDRLFEGLISAFSGGYILGVVTLTIDICRKWHWWVIVADDQITPQLQTSPFPAGNHRPCGLAVLPVQS